MARKDFEVLQTIWKHNSLSQPWEIHIFEACIISKLSYGLVTAVLNKAECSRLDGFQARCLRRILKIPPAYYSRISNVRVFAMAGKKRLSEMIVSRQMILMGNLVFRPAHDPVRCSIFKPHTLELRPLPGPAKRGRPRIRWPVHVLGKCVNLAGSYDELLKYWHCSNSSFAAWKAYVRKTNF